MKEKDFENFIKGMATAVAASVSSSEDDEEDPRHIAKPKKFECARDALDHARKLMDLRRGDKCIMHTEGGDIECLFADFVTSGDMARPLLLFYDEEEHCYASAKISELSAIDPK